MSKRILVTGGSRGLGLEFVRQYLADGAQVIAASRHATSSGELAELQLAHRDSLHIFSADVSDEHSRLGLVKQVAGTFQGLDLLIQCAGIASGNETFRYSFGKLSQSDLERTFLVNAISPLMLTEALTPLLIQGDAPLLVNISSDSGSVARKTSTGEGYGYSASKSALNMITKILSLELKEAGVTVIALHPGWVKTTMAYTERAPLEPQESVRGMKRVLESATIEDSGRFIDWKGNSMPW